MSDTDEETEEEEYEIEDFTSQKNVFLYIEQKGPDVTAPQVMGRFLMHPSLKDDIEMLIDLTWN